tara:strand:- start:2158 stop:3033 length:876 start_codon:yes stop_codon:yes gene_type:complete
VELYQLVSFVVIADEGNMTRAAELLNTSQPAVSAQIRALEDELEIRLFRRTHKGMELTPEGERLKARADTILQDVDAFRNEAEQLRGTEHGTIVLGVNTDAHLLRLKAIYSQLAQRHPEMSLVVKETMSWDVVDALHAKTIDMGFSYTIPDDNRIKTRPLGEIDLAVVAPEAWRDRIEGAGLKELAAMPWVWTSDHCPMSLVLSSLFDEIGETPIKAVVVDQESAILRLVADEVGLGIMPALKAETVADSHGLFTVMTLEKKLVLHLLMLMRRAEERRVRSMIDCIEQAWQ